jgi:hypothetical protein
LGQQHQCLIFFDKNQLQIKMSKYGTVQDWQGGVTAGYLRGAEEATGGGGGGGSTQENTMLHAVSIPGLQGSVDDNQNIVHEVAVFDTVPSWYSGGGIYNVPKNGLFRVRAYVNVAITVPPASIAGEISGLTLTTWDGITLQELPMWATANNERITASIDLLMNLFVGNQVEVRLKFSAAQPYTTSVLGATLEISEIIR